MPLAAETEAALVAALRRAARDHVLPRFRALGAGESWAKTSPDDLVTEADLAVERAIGEAVAVAMPEALMVGEEAVATDPDLVRAIPDAPCAVILDPVDGTWNFAHGLATFGMILAVTEAGETVFGILYDPVMDDMILARRNGGTWAVGGGRPPRRLSLDPGPVAVEAASGFVPLFLFDAEERQRLALATAGLRRAWTLRCSCHEYRVLAQGGADFVLTGTLNPWDHAAGVLAVEEAGGVALRLDGAAYRPGPTEGRLIVARNRTLLDGLTARLAPALAP